jgi:hypothetical protein
MFQWYNSCISSRKAFSRRPKPTAPGRGQQKTKTKPRLSYWDLNLRLPTAANTRQPQNTTAAAFKTFLQKFQNSLPVGYMTTAKDSFLPPHFSKLLENSRGCWSPPTHGLFPVSTSPKTSSIFYPGLTPPNARNFLPLYKLREGSIKRSFTSQSKDSKGYA